MIDGTAACTWFTKSFQPWYWLAKDAMPFTRLPTWLTITGTIRNAMATTTPITTTTAISIASQRGSRRRCSWFTSGSRPSARNAAATT